MRTLVWTLAALLVLLDLAAWGGTFWLAWAAAAPHHTIEANRAFLLFWASFFLIFPAAGAAVLAVEVDS